MTDLPEEWTHRVEDIERQLNTYWVPEYRAIVARALMAAYERGFTDGRDDVAVEARERAAYLRGFEAAAIDARVK